MHNLSKVEIEQKVQSDHFSSVLIKVALVITVLFLLGGLGSYASVVSSKNAMILDLQQKNIALEHQQASELQVMKRQMAVLRQHYEKQLAEERAQKQQLAKKAKAYIHHVNHLIQSQMHEIEQTTAKKQHEIDVLQK